MGTDENTDHGGSGVGENAARPDRLIGEATEISVVGLRGLPEVIGGIESHCAALYPRLAALLPEARIRVYERTQFVAPGIQHYRGLILHPLWAPNVRRLEAFAHTLFAILHTRFRSRARIVHIHGIGPNFWAPLARLLDLTVISTHHGQDYKRVGMSAISRFILRNGERGAMLGAHKVIAVSAPITRDLQSRYASRAGKVEWIPNGFVRHVDDQGEQRDKADALLAELGVESKGYILAVGRIDPAKDLDTLIAAFHRSGIPQKLLIVGSAHHEGRYAEQLMANPGKNVIFAGYRRPSELMPLYRNASLFVLPSLHEGLSVSILEAISCGTPLLVSDIEANVELQLKPENYFPVGDAETLARALRLPHETYRFDDPSFAAQFDWDMIAARTAAIYRRFLR